MFSLVQAQILFHERFHEYAWTDDKDLKTATRGCGSF